MLALSRGAGLSTGAQRRLRAGLGPRSLVAHSFSGDIAPQGTTLEQACQLLQVKTDSDFDEVLQAKNRAMSAHAGNQAKISEVSCLGHVHAPCCLN